MSERNDTLVTERPVAIQPARWYRSIWLRQALIVGVIVVAAWLPRALALDAFVTPDEPKWLSRSANFYHALAQRDWDGTFQREHPGVTITWLGTLGFIQRFPEYAQQTPGPMIDIVFEQWLHENTALRPLDLLLAGRHWVVLAIALTIGASYFPLRTLLGARLAVLGTLALAWDPFFIALSRQLHPDGLLAALTLLALLTFMAWLYGGQRLPYLLASGLLTGLALLTKTPAIFLFPTVALLALIALIRGLRRERRVPGRFLGAPVLWGGLAVFTYFALWPAMWTGPMDVLLRISVQMEKYQAVGHNMPNFFLGQITWEPGVWFYPVVLLWRSSPFTLIGVILALAWLLTSFGRRADDRRRAVVGALLLFALVFVLGTTLVAKKFDRYVLPAFLALDVVAVLGWIGLAESVTRAREMQTAHLVGQRIFAEGLAIVLLLHGLPGFLHYPYYLTYYNPLAGGGRTAPDMLLVGWGEGLDQAARWLQEQAADEQVRVVTWYGPGPMSYYLDHADKILGYYPSPEFWFEADYAVLYVNQWQRLNPAKELIDYFFALEPVRVIEKNGLELARIYDLRGMQPPAFSHIQEVDARFEEWLRLAAFQMHSNAVYAGDPVEITLFWKRTGPIAQNYTTRLQLADERGAALWQDERWPAGMPTSGWPVDVIHHDVYEVAVPPDLPPGSYVLAVTVVNPMDGEPLAVTAGAPGADKAERYPLTALQVQAPDPVALDADWGVVRLQTIRHPSTLSAGQTLLTEIDAAGETDGAWKLSLRLVATTGDAAGETVAGETVAQVDKIVAPTTRVRLDLPVDVAPGEYALVAVIYDPDTLGPLPDQHGAFETRLSTVRVVEAD